ncbi:hypothetical protein BOTBODRAFT_47600 [Botryobasidium botryosum FD-172 SS1]|uniref:Uncharacterized protein n=1 Tax=Botryobasidium botryosum (strain FD-172 SS1) TaxID=930990 RepID=A0A067MC50_BOTB1|nr:hypothetical protein BOTBODRAFT_47600 [Botryobasidium botryosum FD-172 SS1]
MGALRSGGFEAEITKHYYIARAWHCKAAGSKLPSPVKICKGKSRECQLTQDGDKWPEKTEQSGELSHMLESAPSTLVGFNRKAAESGGDVFAVRWATEDSTGKGGTVMITTEWKGEHCRVDAQGQATYDELRARESLAGVEVSSYLESE